MQPKFTPGQWSIDETPVDYVAIRGPSDAPVWLHSVAEIDVLGGDDEQERVARANVRLIAAAPDLYEIVRRYVQRDETLGEHLTELNALARAALSKAEGRDAS